MPVFVPLSYQREGPASQPKEKIWNKCSWAKIPDNQDYKKDTIGSKLRAKNSQATL